MPLAWRAVSKRIDEREQLAHFLSMRPVCLAERFDQQSLLNPDLDKEHWDQNAQDQEVGQAGDKHGHTHGDQDDAQIRGAIERQGQPVSGETDRGRSLERFNGLLECVASSLPPRDNRMGGLASPYSLAHT